MSRQVLLLVDFGVSSGISIALFKGQLKNNGWKEGLIDGAFEKTLDLSDSEIATSVQEEVDAVANQALVKKTRCEVIVAHEELRFCWDWNTL
jgi:hypothetical protein